MNKKHFVLYGIISAFIVLTSSVRANNENDDGDAQLFSSQFICDLDGKAPFTDFQGGSSAIAADGDISVRLSHLQPNTAYTCRISCQFGKSADAPATACKTDRQGKLKAFLPGLGKSGTLSTGCGYPEVTVFNTDTSPPNPSFVPNFCQAGYGEP
jgi:hypothetical protein